VKPAAFDYYAPESLEEASSLLAQHAGDVSVLAGGQSLIPLMNMRMARPGTIVDLGRIGALDYIEQRDGQLAIGAMTRQRVAHESVLAQRLCPLLTEALGHVGHAPIRSRGTIGGSIAHADPAAELPTVITALNGTIRCLGSGGARIVAAPDFFVGFLTTAVEPGELVAEVCFPVLGKGSGSCFLEVARRHGDFALTGIAAAVTLSGKSCTAAYLALNGVGLTPIKPLEVEASLVGTDLSDGVITRAAADVGASIHPSSDLHADAEFRAHLATVLTRRALRIARQRASEELHA
jgi:carbon-monoxide dehydrogenase medium subunit